MASISMALKFLVGPVVVLLTSVAIGLHGILLRIAVVQVRGHTCAPTHTFSSNKGLRKDTEKELKWLFTLHQL
jgi:hypothetical protein